jgi:hypothetical protein
MRLNLPLLAVMACVLASGHAEPTPKETPEGEGAQGPCVIRAGEVVSIRDPRWRTPGCDIEVGAGFRVQVEEVGAPPDPRILRARVERHAACLPAPDEAAILQRLSDKAVAYLRAQGGEDAEIEVVDALCAEKRWVDLIVVEVR